MRLNLKPKETRFKLEGNVVESDNRKFSIKSRNRDSRGKFQIYRKVLALHIQACRLITLTSFWECGTKEQILPNKFINSTWQDQRHTINLNYLLSQHWKNHE